MRTEHSRCHVQTKLKILLAVLTSLQLGCDNSNECSHGQEKVFHCTTANNVTVDVCDSGTQISIAIGKPNERPLVLVAAQRDQVSTFQWDGWGSSHTSSIDVPVGDTIYNVYSGVQERGTGDNAMMVLAGGVTGTTGKKSATYTCTDDSIESHIEGIDLKPAKP